MDFNHLISHYGYIALVVGSLAEGETVTLLGGIAAHQGLLKFPLVVMAVAIGGMIGDQLLYFLGHFFGDRILQHFSRYQARINQAQRMIHQHPYLFVIGVRFMYGFRVVGPLLIGASHLPPRIFLPLNIIGALVWAGLFTTLGYLGGKAIEPWLHHLDGYLKYLFWLLLVIALVIVIRWWLRRHTHKQTDDQK
ncbi:DedA family protein [Enterobacteriaceae bacterium ESL0689]|nr:DedA family protein [Enterobacteriaceae bacterium ESL0689]